MADEDPQISYSIRTMLERLETKLDSALAAIQLKADHADVTALTAKVAGIARWQERHQREHEDSARESVTRRDDRRWKTNAALAALSLLVLILTAVVIARG